MKYISKTSIISKACIMGRSAWSQGVAVYAMELINEMFGDHTVLTGEEIKKTWIGHLFVHGNFQDWISYSRGGCSLIYNEDIAGRLCTPSEFKRAEKNEFIRANSREDWLDCQGRALYQAAEKIKAAIREEIA
jgi:hypothetical protein